MYYSNKYLEYHPFEIMRDYLPYLLLAAVACGGAYLIGFVKINPLILLICQIIGGGGLYIVLSIIFKIPEFKQCLRLIKGFLPHKK